MRDELVQAMASRIPVDLASELTEEFLAIRRDVAARRPGGAGPGRFVESFVQALQYLCTGRYDKRPAVDRMLRTLEGATPLAEGLRICGTRIARSMYTLRNKRGIAHKGDVPANEHDLDFLHSAAQWVMAEMVRSASGCTVDEASALIRQIRTPVGGIVEDFGHRKLVLAELPIGDELLVFLHAGYPRPVAVRQIVADVDRTSSRTVLNALRSLWRQRLIEGTRENGYTLTSKGVREASGILDGFA